MTVWHTSCCLFLDLLSLVNYELEVSCGPLLVLTNKFWHTLIPFMLLIFITGIIVLGILGQFFRALLLLGR